jgi:hypothetical protein
MKIMLNRDQVADFHRDGFVLAPGVFSRDEVEVMVATVETSQRIAATTNNMPDAEGRSSKISLWMNISDDILGLVSRHPRIVNSVRLLLGEDVYHWHSKVMLKLAHEGGAWEWHQDYGYWYYDGCPYPRLVSAMTALDRADEENGCLRVLIGSHHLGRLDHGQVGRQRGAEQERLAAIERLLPARSVLAEPGDVLFFHCNLLHGSGANLSDHPRRAYICCYNAFSNVPVIGKGHGSPVPIDLCEDGALLRIRDEGGVPA